jgi:fucose 4-O-acetylase-like acetyltransferase
MNQRLKWLDIAKAIAIILMVVGHSSLPSIASGFIYAFHMPLFFIASGWTTNWNKYSFYDFIKRRSRNLLFPFFFYSVIVLLIHVHYGWMTMDEWLIKGWGDGYALWFIPVLFIATIIAKSLYTFRETGGGQIILDSCCVNTLLRY